jgi:hypothetical protein
MWYKLITKRSLKWGHQLTYDPLFVQDMTSAGHRWEPAYTILNVNIIHVEGEKYNRGDLV